MDTVCCGVVGEHNDGHCTFIGVLNDTAVTSIETKRDGVLHDLYS